MAQTLPDGYYWCSVRNNYNAFDAPIQVEGDIVRVLVGNGGRTTQGMLHDATVTPIVPAAQEPTQGVPSDVAQTIRDALEGAKNDTDMFMGGPTLGELKQIDAALAWLDAHRPR